MAIILLIAKLALNGYKFEIKCKWIELSSVQRPSKFGNVLLFVWQENVRPLYASNKVLVKLVLCNVEIVKHNMQQF